MGFKKVKICSQCRKEKPLTSQFFYTDKRATNGFQSECKKCHNKQNKISFRNWYKTTKGYLITVFHHIKERCNNPKHPSYENYGGRGIKCKFKSSKQFVDYIMNKLKVDPHNLQVDRINNNGHYEPGNIRFITAKENSNNKKR